jgi:hypothetical protein
MTTTIYQKFIARYADYFTLVEMSDGTDFYKAEIVPANKVAKMSGKEIGELIDELRFWQNEKATWEE